jgi:hypothetical protein
MRVPDVKVKEQRSIQEITAKVQLAFDACKLAIIEQFDGQSPGDYESCIWVIENLAFMALSNGCRLPREETLDYLKIFDERLQTRIKKSLPPRTGYKH